MILRYEITDFDLVMDCLMRYTNKLSASLMVNFCFIAFLSGKAPILRQRNY